jgi:RNA polymerase-associated protein
MATILKRGIMGLYSDPLDPYCHQVRIVLAEKGVSVDILTTSCDTPPEELAEINPYNTLPTLVDRELVLYQANTIMEYLDERFPHPPLLPVYPVSRAKSRLMMYRINNDWYSQVNIIKTGNPEAADKARKVLSDSLTTVAPVFASSPYFLSSEFTLVDCCIAPLLWRLPLLRVKLSRNAKAIFHYMDRVFSRESFQASLSDAEREVRE